MSERLLDLETALLTSPSRIMSGEQNFSLTHIRNLVLRSTDGTVILPFVSISASFAEMVLASPNWHRKAVSASKPSKPPRSAISEKPCSAAKSSALKQPTNCASRSVISRLLQSSEKLPPSAHIPS